MSRHNNYLSNFWIKEGDEREGPEGFGDEDVGDLAKLGKVVAEVVRGHVLRAAAHKHLARHLLDLALLRIVRMNEDCNNPNWSQSRLLRPPLSWVSSRRTICRLSCVSGLGLSSGIRS